MPKSNRIRAIAALIAVAIVAALFVALPAQPAGAAGFNSLSFADGSTSKTFGANGAVIIDGVLAYDDGCQFDQGVKDFFYPATDVYIVPTGSAGGKLTDVGGENPNTIVAPTSGIFLDEVIAFTSPSGTLGEGVYDIVYDTCQDGFLTEGDAVFSQAVKVTMPETLPPASPAIAQIKDRARQQYISWLETHTILTALFAADKAKEILSCIVAPNPGCALAVLAHLMDEGQLGARQAAKIQDLAAALVMNVAKNHGAIWKDPPDADFDQLPVLDRPDDGDLPAAGQPLFDAVTSLTPALADEAALTEALLHAMERYQGAQAAGDGDWALVQARAARDLSDVLADQLTDSTAIETLRTTVAANAVALDERLDAGADFANRVRTSGFAPDEERVLSNLGLSTAEINGLEGEYVAQGTVVKFDAADLTAKLDQLTAGRAQMAGALTNSAASWDAVVAALEAAPGRTMPTADAGGPYTANGGTPITLDATGSAAAAGAVLEHYDWDLDADGDFDDATGASPTKAFSSAGAQLISVRVTDDAGRQAVAHAHVTITGGNQPPKINAAAPPAATTVTVGESLELTVDAVDPEGQPLTYRWQLDDGAPTAGDDSFGWTPAADDIGAHTITVIVSDGMSNGTIRTWRITVTADDADGDGWTGTVDCDDTRVDVSPAMFERLGNDLDDDCDPSTADAPPGGLTGALWSWGQNIALGTGSFADQYSPAPVPGLTDVTQVQGNTGRALAVLANGEVRAWGSNHRGELGIGPIGSARTPKAVLGVGGDGLLTSVVQVETQTMHTVALRQDGTVVAWGNNDLGQGGNGATVAQHQHPVQVIREDGSPLTGAVAVESGVSQQYALMADGTLMSWGALQCAGQYPWPEANTAQPLPLFGDGIVQVEAGHGMVMARKADGSVWACAGDNELLDRGKSQTLVQSATPMPMLSFGAGSGVIDISSGGDGAVALKADGSVYLWGKNTNGTLNALGVPAGVVVTKPTKVTLPPGPPVVDVEMDASCHTMALRADGSILSMGCNTFGAAGIGSPANPLPGITVLDIDGAAFAQGSTNWNGYALVRPVDDADMEPVAHWIDAVAHDASIGEAAGGTVEVTLSDAAPADVEVTWAIEAGATGTATIPAGATSVAVPVSVTDDALDEDDEVLSFHIVAVSHGVGIERGIATVTVVDDDGAPAVSVAPVTVDEGNTSLTDTPVALTLSAPSGKDVEVLWATTDGTAESPADYAAATGHVEIPAGETEAIVHLAVNGDEVVEPAEAFDVTLTAPVNATLGQATAAVTIVDDEPLRLTVTSPTVTEGHDGTTPATFTVSVTQVPAGTTVTVPWSVGAGTAEIPADVTAASGSLVFDDETSALPVEVPVVGDTADELDEVFRIVVTGAAASDGRPVVHADPTVAKIVDDDVTPEDPGEDPGEEPQEPAFDFDGFYQPVDNLPTVNSVQSGRAIPVKFSLAGDHGLDIFEAGYPASQRISCASGDPLDSIEETATPGASELTYDAGTDTYHYVWKTQKSWKGQCHQLVVRFVDGTEALAEFRFR